MNAGIAEIVGILKLKMYHMEFTKMFRHPKYYKELRKRNRDRGNTTEQSIPQSDQAISANKLDGDMKVRAPGPGLKQQAASDSQVVNQVKLSSQSQAPSTKPQASSAKLRKHQATSLKPQAASVKLQATSDKLHDS